MYIKNNDIEIEINIPDIQDNIEVSYIAASPADTMTNFSGSGLPYASKEQAYYNTPNKGTVRLVNNKAIIKLQKPNSYYKDFNNLQTPHVSIFINDKHIADVMIDNESINYRSLQYPMHTFDTNKRNVIMSQESILRSKNYSY